MRSVLLVRPHEFIVEGMKALLARAGIAARRLENLRELDSIAPELVAGCVISTAIDSTIKASFGETYEQVRRAFPTAPVAATTLARDPARAISLIRGELGDRSSTVNLEVAMESSIGRAGLGTSALLLVLRSGEIYASPPWLIQLVQDHFGRSEARVVNPG